VLDHVEGSTVDESMTKCTLLERMRLERVRWEALLSQVDRQHMERPRVAGDWSTKDIIGHIAAYERGLVEWLEAASRDEALTFSVLDHPDVDYRNALIIERVRSQSVQYVLLESKRVFERLLQLVEGLSEEDVIDQERTAWFVKPRWKESRPLWECIADDSYRHYHQHIPDIRAWLIRQEHVCHSKG